MEAMLNKDGKLFGKISIIDIIVVVIIIALAIGVYARYTSNRDAAASSEAASIEYVYEVKSVRDFTIDALEKLGPVYDDDTKEYLGEVVDVTAEPSQMEISLVSGQYTMVEVPERYDVYVTIRVDGEVNALGYYTSTNTYLGAGSTFNMNFKYASTNGKIVSISQVEE